MKLLKKAVERDGSVSLTRCYDSVHADECRAMLYFDQRTTKTCGMCTT